MKWFLTLFFACAAFAVQAATLCVGPAATGNGTGSDWNNLREWSSTPARGDTWYLVDGAYSGKSLGVATSGSTLITIKKATGADHGGITTGWSSTLGDGQATFSGGISFSSSYWVFDGQTGGGPGSWNSGFGFKITETGDGRAVLLVGQGSTANNITIRHVDLQGKGSVSTAGGSASNDGLAIYGDSNVTLSYFWMHGIGRCPFFISPVNLVVEYGWVESYNGSSAVHSEVASIWGFGGTVGDVTFRYNLFTDIRSTGGLMWDNSSNPNSHLYVYGNVFYKPAGASWEQANGVIGGWTGGGGEEFHNCWVYNNTFIGIDQSILSTFPNIHSGGQARNNLFYNCRAPSFGCFPTHDSNHFINSGGTQGEANATSATSGDPFVNYIGLDFRLKANTALGANLGSLFSLDPLGIVRTSWTRGAYEFGAQSTTPVISVSPLTLNLGSVNILLDLILFREANFTVQNTGGGTLTGTASVAAPFSIVSGGSYSLGPNQSQAVTVRFSPTLLLVGILGNHSKPVTFTGGGGATATATGTATSTPNSPPSVSAITHNAADIDPGASGNQIYEGTVVQYSGSASDPDGNSLTWQWIYTVNGGAEVVHQSGAGTVSPVSFSYGAGTAGRTYVWKLRVNDGLTNAQSQLTVQVRPPPAVGGGVAFEAETGVITAPFVSAGGAISQAATSDLAGGGRAVYTFTVTNAGAYVIQTFVNAPSLTQNSFYVNIDAEPQDPAMAWDILPPTVGFENRLVSWRGNGTADANEFVPKIFNLTVGTHQLIVRGREADVELDRFAILVALLPPQNLRVVPSP